MAIVRKSTTKNYSIIPNVGLIDPNLSAKAKGLLAYMLTLPNDWEFYQEEIEKHFTDGKQSIRSALNELIDHAYIVKQRKRDANGRLRGTDWIVYDSPEPISENHKLVETPADQQSKNNNAVKSTFPPTSEKPTVGKPMLENQPLLSTNYTNNLSKQRTNKQKDKEEEGTNSALKISSGTKVKRSDVFKFWENNGFGSTSPTLYDNIDFEVEDFKNAGVNDGPAYELIKHAMLVAVDHNARNWSYIQAILNSYHQKNVKSVEQVEANEKQFKSKHKQALGNPIPDRGEYDNNEPLPF